eukprot:10812729-Prorocentrum_lima.AAC.1
MPVAAHDVPCCASVGEIAEPPPEVVQLVGQKRALHDWHVGVTPGLHLSLRKLRTRGIRAVAKL